MRATEEIYSGRQCTSLEKVKEKSNQEGGHSVDLNQDIRPLYPQGQQTEVHKTGLFSGQSLFGYGPKAQENKIQNIDKCLKASAQQRKRSTE